MEDKGKTELFERMPVQKAVMRLTVPMILSSLTTMIYNMADTFFVGALNDPVQSAAISLASPVMLTAAAIGMLFGVGTSSVMSRALGAKDYNTVKKSSAFGFYGALAVSVLFSVVYTVLKQPVMGLIGVRPDTAPASEAYLFWTVILGTLPSTLQVVMMNIIRAEGESGFSSLGVAGGCILNIVLDPFFVLPMGLNMGAEGAGFATFVSNCATCAYFFILLYKRREKIYASIRPENFSLDRGIVLGVCNVGIPACIQTFLNVLGMTVMNNFMVGYGSDAMAAMGIAHRINIVPVNIALGGSQGIMPLVSYNYASGNYARMKKAITYTMKIMLVFLIVCAVVFFVAGDKLTEIFMDNDTVIAYGGSFLRGLCLGLPFMCVDYLVVAVFQAVGKGKAALGLGFARKVALDIPALIILNRLFPMYGLAYAQLVEELVICTVAMIALRRMFCKLTD